MRIFDYDTLAGLYVIVGIYAVVVTVVVGGGVWLLLAITG